MKQALLLLALVPAATADAAPYSYASKSKYADVDYSWSAEAGAVPALVKRFKAELAKDRVRTIRCGKEESQIRIETGSPGIACSSSTKITTSGRTPRLLSLAKAVYAFTGGAHGNGGTTGLLWDLKRGHEISFGSLFLTPTGYSPVLRTAYCTALNAERKKRRGGFEPQGVPEFNSCPKFSELALIPADSGHRGRLNQVHVIAAPYTAGSYAEGEYDIPLPVTRPLIAALKPEFRPSFAVQPQ